jgi:hypothetical protein
MGTDCNVTLRASCANQPDELHVYSRQVAKGILLLELLKRLALGAALIRQYWKCFRETA